MYRLDLIIGMAALGIAGLISSPARAQPTDSLEARIEQLTAEWVELRRQADVFDSVRATADSITAARVRYDSITHGVLTVVIESRHGNLARPAVEEASASLQQTLGATLNLVRGTVFNVTLVNMRARGRVRLLPDKRIRIRIDTDRRAGIAVGIADEPSEIESELVRLVARAVEQLLTDLVPAEITTWAGPIGPIPPQYDMRRSYLDLVGNPTSAAQGCWNRDYAACRVGLGLIGSDDPLSDWYSDADRRTIVMNTARPNWTVFTPHRDQYDRCVDARDGEACLVILQGRNYREPPLHSMHATEVTLSALRAGGEGAFSRMVTATGSIVERLEATAAMPFDSVLARWRDHIDHAAGTPVRVTARTGLTTIIWTLVFMFAATRSTRWRSH